MKNSFRTGLLVVFSALSLLLTYCTDPLEVGADLLTEDRARVGFTDTVKLVARTEIADSVRAFSPGVGAIAQFLFGRTESPYFGITQAGLYFEPLLLRDLGGNLVQFLDGGRTPFLDSVVLVLPIDSSGIYGSLVGDFGVEVYEVTESMEPQDINGTLSFFSNVDFQVNPVPIASTTFRPNFQDSIFVKEQIDFSTLDTVDLRAPHVRIRLDDSFGERFLAQDTMTYSSDSLFLEFFRGLYVKPTGVSPGLMNFTMNRSWPGIYFYYREGVDTLTYNFEVGSIGRRISQYKHDYDSYIVGDFIDDPVTNDSLMFLQGLQGLRIALEMPGLQNLSEKVINKAELELTVEVPAGYDIQRNFLPGQIAAFVETDEGVLAVIDDVAVLPNDLDVYFGGQPIDEEDTGRRFYTLNISIHTQYIINGTEPQTLYLQILPRAANASQVIFKGPGAMENPPLLKLSFTDL
ncbi:MAG: DUF4270 family protein [Bacteroidota bacterium]